MMVQQLETQNWHDLMETIYQLVKFIQQEIHFWLNLQGFYFSENLIVLIIITY